ncbi:phage holin family protein [uncultured Granulicatella sp.]|uniref:phage holin family protein n=1 Tax=uncultured Granulicatella sp. TaxID=316089 RepID=UPI002601D073|nr:phage holin family protein [uncultured Granulicatella sp.]
MKTSFYYLQSGFFALGAIVGGFLGGKDGLLYALLVLVILDYVTGVLNAIDQKRLSSSVGYKGIARKVLIFVLVGTANVVDVHILGKAGVLRATVIFFYISNEGISILENASYLGLPIPQKFQSVLKQLHQKEEN